MNRHRQVPLGQIIRNGSYRVPCFLQAPGSGSDVAGPDALEMPYLASLAQICNTSESDSLFECT